MTTASTRPTDQYDVFLSYARKDDYLTPVAPGEEHTYHHDPARSFTRRLYNALTAAGLRVWWDRESMPNRGLTFLNEIRDAVSISRFVVYIDAEHARRSDYVRAEWGYARSICKPVIPLLRQGDHPDIPQAISMGHAPDLRDLAYFDEKLRELLLLLADTPRLATLYSVPNLPEWYIERGGDVQDLQAALRADALQPVVVTSRQQTLTLHGMGGLGKTTLASALCRVCDVRFSFPDGVFWLEMGRTPDVTTRQADIGTVFGDPREEYPDAQRGKARLSALLPDKAVLIVLDDVWDYRVVEAFRVEAPRSRLLVTTRSGGIAVQLGVTSHAIDTLTDEEGVALIGKRLNRAADADNPYRADEIAIVRLLGGHTLAISIAAARIAEKGAASAPRFRQRLQDRRADGASPLGDLQMQADDKNYNLELSLAESYDALSAVEQQAFRQLGVFAADGTFDLAAAGAVWGGLDDYTAEDRLDTLTRLALLTAPEAGRYALHNLLRDYARALAGPDELAAAAGRHFAHYAALHGDTRDHTDTDYLQSITIDLENLQAALAWGFDHAVEAACDLLAALDNFLRVYQSTAVYRPLLDRALGAAEAASYPRGLANTLKALGDLMVREDALGEARAYYDRALPVYEQIGARLGLANTLQALGDLMVREDALGEARAYYDRALPVYEQIGDRLGLANTLRALGDLMVREDALGEARAYYDRALPVYEQIGARLGLANTLQALGDLMVREDALGEARAYYDRALPVYEQIGARLGLANTLQALGDLLVREDALGEARAYYDRALPVYEQIGDRLGLANTLKALGDLLVREAALGEARAYYDRALPVYEQIGDRLGLANTLKALGDLLVREAALGEARAYYDRALPVYEQIGARLGLANTLKALGDLLVREAALGEARAYYDRALPVYEQIGARLGLANTLKALGDLMVREAALGEARAYYDRALPVYEQIGDRLGLANTLRALGDLMVREAALGEARAYYDRALPVYEQIGARLGLANTLMSVGDMMVKQKLWSEAVEYYQPALTLARQIQAQLSVANILYDYGFALFELGRQDEGIAALQECVGIFERIDPRRWAAISRRRLSELLQRSGHPPLDTPDTQQESPQQAFVRQVMAAYQADGLDGVRALLAGMGVPEEQIAGVLAQLAALGGGDEDGAG